MSKMNIMVTLSKNCGKMNEAIAPLKKKTKKNLSVALIENLSIEGRKLLRGHNGQLTHKLDPGNRTLLTPNPCPMYILPTVFTAGATFRNADL